MPTTSLQDYIARFSGLRVAVVGDLMLDKYIFGQATRISQEAPVPVVHVTRQQAVPGGAANVARNLVSLGAHAEVFGAVADDSDGQELLRLLRQDGVGTDNAVRFDDRSTTVKTRILAASQQVVRVDLESTAPFPDHLQDELCRRLEQRLAAGELDAIILEDYAKGLFTRDLMARIVSLARRHHVPITLDPHASHPFNTPGLTIMTPNRKEAFTLAAASDSDESPDSNALSPDGSETERRRVGAVGSRLMALWDLDYLLITLGGRGMALFRRGGGDAFEHIPTVARQVFDVSGAGDTVMATVVLAMLAQAPVGDACRIANVAAGVVVGRVGTSAIEADVLARELASR